jgi:hypothetical protein
MTLPVDLSLKISYFAEDQSYPRCLLTDLLWSVLVLASFAFALVLVGWAQDRPPATVPPPAATWDSLDARMKGETDPTLHRPAAADSDWGP